MQVCIGGRPCQGAGRSRSGRGRLTGNATLWGGCEEEGAVMKPGVLPNLMGMAASAYAAHSPSSVLPRGWSCSQALRSSLCTSTQAGAGVHGPACSWRGSASASQAKGCGVLACSWRGSASVSRAKRCGMLACSAASSGCAAGQALAISGRDFRSPCDAFCRRSTL